MSGKKDKSRQSVKPMDHGENDIDYVRAKAWCGERIAALRAAQDAQVGEARVGAGRVTRRPDHNTIATEGKDGKIRGSVIEVIIPWTTDRPYGRDRYDYPTVNHPAFLESYYESGGRVIHYWDGDGISKHVAFEYSVASIAPSSSS